ncbi:hypothetical protein [Streptomyces sp. NPDC020681]|uniref:hypothetical protein n=1 Tax=Streptomyces sp. NPDC020681 TaxID=3365083 RepID=UPI00378E2D7A
MDRDDRAKVTRSDLRGFLSDVHSEQRSQGVDYAELRVSPRRFLADGMSWSEFLEIIDSSLLALRDPAVRAVLLVNRDSPQELLDDCLNLLDDLPSAFIGVDLAGDETTHPDVTGFEPFFAAAASAGLGASVHAGEFGPEEHVWRALDRLGARRIGHGVAAGSSRALVRRLARDSILVEVSLSSNAALGAVPSLAAHPVLTLLEHGVPVSFNADIPLHTGRSFTDEIDEAAVLLDLDRAAVLDIQASAAAFRFPARSEALPSGG